MVVTALTHLAATSGSAILGGVMRFLSDNAKDRKERELQNHKFQMAQFKVSEDSALAARADAMKPISKTRRFVVMAVISAVLTMMFVGGIFDATVNVPVVGNENSFFGFTWGGQTDYDQLKGFVLIPEVLLAMNAIISMLFGSNIVKR